MKKQVVFIIFFLNSFLRAQERPLIGVSFDKITNIVVPDFIEEFIISKPEGRKSKVAFRSRKKGNILQIKAGRPRKIRGLYPLRNPFAALIIKNIAGDYFYNHIAGVNNPNLLSQILDKSTSYPRKEAINNKTRILKKNKVKDKFRKNIKKK